METTKRIHVLVRVRPPFTDEMEDDEAEAEATVRVTPAGLVRLVSKQHRVREFRFDRAFGPDATQDDVFVALGETVVDAVLRGHNGCVCAYGQTGSGKTYTMGILEEVNDQHAGLIPRSIARVFEHAEEQQRLGRMDVTVTLSFLQLYCDVIQDLLADVGRHHTADRSSSNSHSLPIREDPERGFYVDGLREYCVGSYAEAEVLVNLGLEGRALAATLMNATSSRSHIVLTLRVEQRARGVASRREACASGKLVFCDLAGSERVRRSSSSSRADDDVRFAEAKSINSSLSALGGVIAALVELSHQQDHLQQQQSRRTPAALRASASATSITSGVSAPHHHHMHHVPYRDSKLTRLLQDSIGGTARTALIATVGPARRNQSETLSTLSFAARCMNIRVRHGLEGTGAVAEPRNRGDRAELERLRERVTELELEVTQQAGVIDHLQAQLRLERVRALVEGRVPPSSSSSSAGPKGARGTAERGFDFATLELLIDQLSDLRAAGVDALLAQTEAAGRRGNRRGSEEAHDGLGTVMMTPIVANKGSPSSPRAVLDSMYTERDDDDDDDDDDDEVDGEEVGNGDFDASEIPQPWQEESERAVVLRRIAALSAVELQALSPATREEVQRIQRDMGVLS